MASILVVDDMAIFRDPIAVALSKYGHAGRTAANGKQALAEIDHDQPDLVLLDITMSGMDGLAVLEQLRAQKETQDLPIIMLTDASERKRITAAAKLGISSYMLKSDFSLKDLLERIEQALTPANPAESSSPNRDTATPAPTDPTGPAMDSSDDALTST